MKTAAATFSPEEMSIKYVCGIDIGSQSCAGCILRLDKSVVVKPVSFANAREGWQLWEEKLSRLDAMPSQILIGMEATSRYGENLYVRPDATCIEWSISSQPSVQGCLQSLSASLVTVRWKARGNVQGSF
jgi:hypothetical protein